MENTGGEFFRVIEISDQRTVLELMCTALAAFDARFCHLMYIGSQDQYYGLTEEVEESDDLEDADLFRISHLNLNIADELELTYDYEECWLFKLTLLDSTEMEKGTGATYPRLINGAGPGILEGRHEAYNMMDSLNLIGERPREELEILFQNIGGVPEMPEFNFEQASAKFQGNVKKAVKVCRNIIAVELPESHEMIFRVTLNGAPRKLWRRIAVSSNDTLYDLINIILVSFEAEFDHLFDIRYKNFRFGVPGPYDFEPIKDARRILLFQLLLHPGDQMLLTYDYGDNWQFTVTYKGDGCEITDLSKYPKVLSGKGWGILEDDHYHLNWLISCEELDDDTKNELLEYYEEIPDLTEFDLKENDRKVRKYMQRVYRDRGQ